MTYPVMIWVAFLPFLVSCAHGNRTVEQVPFFHGHVFENSSPGSRVNGLSVPLKRLNSQRQCGTGESAAHFKLLGDGSENFRVFAHHKRGQILLKTSGVLDREERDEYALSLGLCCGQCAGLSREVGEESPVVAEVASIKVDVLDTNDHQPTFPGADVKLSLDDATALRTAIYKVTARDNDSGKNAQLIYFALPKNGSFYVVPKTGDILLVDSILGLEDPIKFQVFARDRGWPPRTSQSIAVEINPRQWPVAPLINTKPGEWKAKSQLKVPARRSRSVLESDSPVFINVSEDAGIGSVVMNLNPVRFLSATFELVEPDVESSPVSVSRDSGDIVISRRLDRETEPLVEISVKVQDKRGPEWYLVRVELTVMDVNDNIPEWTMVPAPYLAVVSPDAPAGSLVYKLHAQDGDEGNNGEVEYFLSDGGDGRFEVDRKNGQVRTTGLPLQRDREYLLTVVAADRLGSRSAPVVVSVVAGARPPQFTNASFTIAIPENTPEGQPFLLPRPCPSKKPIPHPSINPRTLFSFSQDWDSPDPPIDYGPPHIVILLLAPDPAKGWPAEHPAGKTVYVMRVRVVIVDENDCVPEFLQSIYSKDGVPETVTTATSLLQVSANDCDSEENAELTYYTLSPDFTISPHGTIFPVGPLDYERPNHLYEFVVMAIDKGDVPRTGTTTVRIRMANVNDEAPEFSQHIYRTFVSEDAGPNTLVATVLAKDPDGDGITYKITTGNEEGNFIIDSQKGLIRLRSSPPPYLQGVEYVLNVTATDDNASSGPQALSSTAQVIVGVDDVNNNKPVFEKCQQYRESTSVLENQPAGTFVLQVHAVDADEGSNGRVTYGFMHKDSTVPAFSIHPDTGVIVTARKFDRERQREYAVTVTATDQAADPLIGICQLNILILDQNDNSPKFENIRYEYFLREDTMIGTSFLRVAAHDDDFGTNAAITYSMSSEQPEYLRVNPLTGWVYVNQPISQRTYITREIVATDGGNLSSSVELAVTITNVKNQPPQWEKDSYSVVIPENTVRDTPIVTIKATSPLGDPRVTYNLEDGMVPETNMPVRFYLTPNREDGSASILVAEPLDYETTRNFMLRVRAQNVAAVPLAAFTTVYINVTDVNDNVPFFTSSIYEASVTEGAESGTLVFQVLANDLDLGLNGKISYSLLEDRSGDHQYFRIDPELGFIYSHTVFDRETKSSYLLEVQSVDGWESARPGKHGQPNSDTAYVRVFISDVNDNKPAFAQASYEVDVDEDADVGFAILTVGANDGDEGGNAKLRYQITSGNTGGVFDVEPEVGTIFIAQPLDYEQNKRYKLHVLASDGKWEDYTTVTVNVVNKNDEAPVFTVNEYYGSVTEELDGSPVFVLQVTASDPDKDADQEALRYSLHGQGAESEFIIDEVTGKIYAQRTLDREERAVWRFVVLATDEGGEGLTGFTDVIINVWDINDNAPVFTCAPSCHGDVAENSAAGTSVMEMTATDLDDSAVGQNAVLTYRILGSLDTTQVEMGGVPTFSEMFTINPTTGTITVAMGGLDREQVESYLLVVEARDGGGMTGTGTATIQIKDVNDHAPRFTDHSCLARISENAEPNAEVLELAAEDKDTGENAQLTFSVVAGDQEQKFYMVSHKQEQRGTLRLKKRLDYERHSEQRFNLTLKVEDLDFSSLLHCMVEVEDYNDHGPVFIPHLLSLAPLPEDISVGTSVARLVASDSDSGQNRDITYSLSEDSDPDGLFTIDQSGVLSVAQPLDRERISQHYLVVIATDHGVPPLTGSATVQLPLLDVNDNGPEFEVAYAPVVFENVAGPQVVRVNLTSTLLRAVDRDSPENGPPFHFSVPSDYRHSNDFYLQDNLNGTVTLTALRMFDRERQKEFLIPIIMSDSGHPAQTVTSTLTVTIGDQNDHAHMAGEKKIFINSHRGRMPTTVLGKVYSPDPDDWDNKTYVFEGHVPSYFILNKRTGFLIIKENAPPDIYHFQVRVSDGVWPDAVSSVTVHVRELRDEAIYNSGSLRLADITAKEFIELRGKQRSRCELLVDFLSEMLSVSSDDVNVFSLMDVKERMLDVRFAVHGGPAFLQPEKIHGYLAAHKQKLQSFLQVSVSQVRVDECPSSECAGAGGCTNVLNVRDTPTIVDCGTMSLVSVTVESTAVCSCPGREQSHQPCTAYPRNPCFNGGVCVDTQHGYRCQCPAQFEGPECQQNKHSFHGNGYAWFPPIMPCFESHMSLEFITDVADGLLLYSGPLAQLQAWDNEDFMAIELIDGTPTLKINHGSGTVVLQLPGNVNVADRRWHRLDVRSNSKEVRFTLDRCSGAAVMETEGLGSWLTTEDHSSCEVLGVTPNTDRHLNMSQVLQLGGVNEDIPYIYPQLQHKHFTGCIRNLIVDSKLYDLGSPADSQSSSPGCLTTDSSCVNMGYPSCGHRGRCHGEWGSFSCQCVPGYTGHQCEEVIETRASHAHFQLAPAPGRGKGSSLVRTANTAAHTKPDQRSRRIPRLEIFQGLLCVFYNLGDGDYNLTLPTYRLDNGEWHEVFLDRHDNEMILRLDGGGGQREITGLRGRSREIIIDRTVVMLGNTFPSGTNKSFQGCMRDVRLNGRYMPLDSQPRDGVSQVSIQGLSLGCSSDSCKRNQCSPPFTCVDLWRVHECRCPPGHMIRVNGTRKSCVYTLCATRPCHRGTCVAQSPSKFTCHCPEGYRGHHCETTLAIYREDVGLSFSSLFAICICFMALLGSYYNAYDMAELQKSLQPSPAQSVQYCRSRALQHHPPPPPLHHHHHLLHQATPARPLPSSLDSLSRTASSSTLPPSAASTSSTATTTASLRRDVPPTRLPAQGQARPSQLARRSLSFSSQDLARYLCEIIRDADQHPDTGPFDSLQVFSTEGGGSPAGSLSSFSSAGLEAGNGVDGGGGGGEGRREETLGEWGPRFEKLRALYEQAEASDL
ncbi:LOW QUALITY PROTEIN: neural-cadherin-like [Etheostoma spectabile]|uniref:LOW QUALITY PROTEIN: neural-cadherin-like n=1 Tax=Etheostoma spectabile TaxID=54343 RepID=UPI0013AFBD69|nr:LOW QUALITY PROTEIN: neural-cadherin-like [Etheostoma spectabile]